MSFFASRIRLSVALLVSLVGCSGDGPSHTDPKTPSAPALQGHAAVDDGETYRVRFETTKGPFVVEVHPAWAPLGAARFKELVTSGYYDGCKFFRVVPGFVVQWGMHGDPNTNAKWQENRIPDDPVVRLNKRGTITFAATPNPDTRTCQVFVNLVDNPRLDGMGFATFGEVIEGMNVVDQITAEYGEAPDQGRIRLEGNEYLNSTFPRMDSILTASLVEDSAKSGEEPLQQVPAQDTVPGTDKKAVPADAAEGTSL